MIAQATHYDADGTGACSFAASTDRMVAAINRTDYDHAAWCGACLEVAGPNGEIVVRVVDSCPGCKPGDLDLSVEAFAEIAPPKAGRIPISWRPVPCAVDGALGYAWKDGSNAHWAAIQVRNHRHPIASVEARDRGGAWKPLKRSLYNYFIGSALGPGPHALRITDTRGHTVEDPAIALGDAETRTGTVQFPACAD